MWPKLQMGISSHRTTVKRPSVTSSCKVASLVNCLRCSPLVYLSQMISIRKATCDPMQWPSGAGTDTCYSCARPFAYVAIVHWQPYCFCGCCSIACTFFVPQVQQTTHSRMLFQLCCTSDCQSWTPLSLVQSHQRMSSRSSPDTIHEAKHNGVVLDVAGHKENSKIDAVLKEWTDDGSDLRSCRCHWRNTRTDKG